MNLNQQIFRAYDIRGIFPSQINQDLASALGQALVSFLQAKQLVVGYDIRLSSSQLAQGLIKGINQNGADVLEIGLATTPMFYLAVNQFKADGGVMITASHNPGDYNGFKLVRAKGRPISQQSGLLEIKELILKSQFKPAKDSGKLIKKEILNQYIENAFRFVEPKEIGRLKIVADAANAMAGLALPCFFEKLALEVIPLFWDLDGRFPNHQPNPMLLKNLRPLQEKVIKEKADLGIAFDGDADRIVFLDEQGQLILPSLISALLSRIILKEQPHQKILIDPQASRVVKETIESNKGQVILSPRGHSFFKEKMAQEKIVLGAESSGHYYLQANNNIESPLIILLYILRELSRTGQKASELIKPFQKYFASGEINFKARNREKALQRIERHYGQGRVSHLDGLNIEYSQWWFSLRMSNTEPVLRLNLEAKTKELMEEKLKEIKHLIQAD